MGVVAQAPQSGTDGHIGRIPVRNVWLLMLYASDLFRMRGVDRVALERDPDELPDLVAELLTHAVAARLRRTLTLGYRRRRAVLNRVRGRIDVLVTARHQLLRRGLVACRFDDFTVDTPRSRFVCGALLSIWRIVRRADLRHRCRRLAGAMQALGISAVTPTRAQMSMEHVGRNDAVDRFMLSAAQLALDLALPTETAGVHSLALADRDQVWARHLFERAVGGFYATVLEPLGWRVRPSLPLQWQVDRATAGVAAILPSMRTDIVLDHEASSCRIVIDTKFNAILTTGWYRDNALRSSYLYQMYAYLQSQTGRGHPLADRASGLLLHPAVGAMVDETAVIQGHAIRFATVDLAASAATIRARLLELCGVAGAGGSAPGPLATMSIASRRPVDRPQLDLAEPGAGRL